MVYVPHLTWHFVVNLTSTVALTQNYAASTNLPGLLRFLRDKQDQISGLGAEGQVLTSELYELLVSKLVQEMEEEQMREIIKKSEQEDEVMGKAAGNLAPIGGRVKTKKSRRYQDSEEDNERKKSARGEQGNVAGDDERKKSTTSNLWSNAFAQDANVIKESCCMSSFSFGFSIGEGEVPEQ
ncbi:hypothetical protein EON65_50550 [archaeon]|nr:MAG: hypothetical protein EON65_50550 [archaeon]